MNSILTELQEVMQQELVAYKEILAKARQKKEALLKNDVSMLDHIVAHEWNLVKTLRQLEKEREGMLRSIAREQGIDEKKISLTDIVDMLEGSPREEFAALKTELKHVIAEIDTINRANKGLVDTHLQYSAFCVNLLTGHLNTLNTYSYSGQMSEAQESATLVFDRMV